MILEELSSGLEKYPAEPSAHGRMLTLFLCTPLLLITTLEASDDEVSKTERLWEAAKKGDLATVKALIEAGVDVDARTEFDATAVYFAASNDHAEVCAALADAGADLNVADNFYDNSPIGMAAWLGFPECVRVLVEKGAENGTGALFAAVSNGHVEVVEVLLATIDPPQGVLDSTWQQANAAGRTAVAQVLADAGATVAAAEPAEAGVDVERTRGDTSGADGPWLWDEIEDFYHPVVEPAAWPRFRGPGASGIADGQHPPLSWNLETGEHLRWRTPVPGLGHSSPIVHGNRVFITTAVGEREHTGVEQGDRGWIGAADEAFPHRFEVLCHRLSDGELLWRTVCHEGVPQTERHWKASQANCTVAVDETRVVAFFGAEGLYCLDHAGKLLWKKDLGVLDAGWFVDDSFGWGFASSPVIWKDRVLVQCDVAGPDFVAAFRLEDGEELWRAERDELPAWGTPVVAEGPEGPEVIFNATNHIKSYDVETGDVLWNLSGNSKITVASPVVAEGLVYVTGGYQRPAPIYAVRLGSMGDLTLPSGQTTSEAVPWSNQRDGVYQPTPLVYEGLLYMLRANGVLGCYDATDGTRLWRERVAARGSEHTASPIAADGYLYLTAEGGEVYVVLAGDEFQLVAENSIGATTLTTPAISNGVILFRTLDELIAIAHR